MHEACVRLNVANISLIVDVGLNEEEERLNLAYVRLCEIGNKKDIAYVKLNVAEVMLYVPDVRLDKADVRLFAA